MSALPTGLKGVVVATAALKTVSWCFAPRGHARSCQQWGSTTTTLQKVLWCLAPRWLGPVPLQAGAAALEGVL